jgi:hypothetical protein
MSTQPSDVVWAPEYLAHVKVTFMNGMVVEGIVKEVSDATLVVCEIDGDARNMWTVPRTGRDAATVEPL